MLIPSRSLDVSGRLAVVSVVFSVVVVEVDSYFANRAETKTLVNRDSTPRTRLKRSPTTKALNAFAMFFFFGAFFFLPLFQIRSITVNSIIVVVVVVVVVVIVVVLVVVLLLLLLLLFL